MSKITTWDKVYRALHGGKEDWRDNRPSTDHLPGFVAARQCLAEYDFSDMNLPLSDFTYAHARHAQFTNARLSHSTFRGSICNGASFERASLHHADFTDAKLRRAVFRRADLTGADFCGAELHDTDFTGAVLARTCFEEAKLYNVTGLNPHMIQPLYSMKTLPPDTTIVAYKLTNKEAKGIYYGNIAYVVGKTVTEERYLSDEGHPCGAGISLGTLQYCLNVLQQSFLEMSPAAQYRVFEVHCTPEDIVAVPWTGNGKFRVWRCTVVRELSLDDLWQTRTHLGIQTDE